MAPTTDRAGRGPALTRPVARLTDSLPRPLRAIVEWLLAVAAALGIVWMFRAIGGNGKGRRPPHEPATPPVPLGPPRGQAALPRPAAPPSVPWMYSSGAVPPPAGGDRAPLGRPDADEEGAAQMAQTSEPVDRGRT